MRIVFSLILFLITIIVLSNRDEVTTAETARIRFTDGFELHAELADTETKRAKGLAGHEPLKENEGMLFLHPSPDRYGYWMKGMTFPIDIIWLNSTSVVDTDTHLQPQTSSFIIYQPSEPSDRVLEVSAGFIDRHNIKVGDILDIKMPMD